MIGPAMMKKIRLESMRICSPTQLTTTASARTRGSLHLRLVDKVVPRYRFGSSIYSTPVLLLLRLFYGASSFDPTQILQGSPTVTSDIRHVPSSALNPSAGFLAGTKVAHDGFGGAGLQKMSVSEWSSRILTMPPSTSNRLISLTWVKGLASNLTHEYLQLIVFDPRSNASHRLIVDRQEDGDTVFAGHDWSSYSEPKPCHTLPLPLLSLSFHHLAPSEQPLLSEFVQVLVRIGQHRPRYDAMKYMCWWYAETVLGEAFALFGGNLKEWEHARLRYSLVIRSTWLKRRALTDCAERFRTMNAETMIY